MFLKPIVKTLLLSSIVFVVLVFLGMKYHWITFFKSPDSNVELSIPKRPIPLTTTKKDDPNKATPFQLEIIQSSKQPITANMSKEQILEGCLQLFKSLGMNDETMIDIAAGDCVVSNYQETIQNTSNQNNTPENIQQRRSLEQHCYQQVKGDARLTAIEKQLLWGVCVADGLSAN